MSIIKPMDKESRLAANASFARFAPCPDAAEIPKVAERMTPIEFRLLEGLRRAYPESLSTETLGLLVIGDGPWYQCKIHTIYTHLHRLRRKMRDLGMPVLIGVVPVHSWETGRRSSTRYVLQRVVDLAVEGSLKMAQGRSLSRNERQVLGEQGPHR